MSHHHHVEEGVPITCQYCDRTFIRTKPFGRPRLYCKRSCRQRAYEHRKSVGIRGANFQPLRPNQTRVEYSPQGRADWGFGRATFLRGKGHAMIPGPVQEKQFFRSLCGLQLKVQPLPFQHGRGNPCQTCLKLAGKYRPSRPFPGVADALALESRILELEAQFGIDLQVDPWIPRFVKATRIAIR